VKPKGVFGMRSSVEEQRLRCSAWADIYNGCFVEVERCGFLLKGLALKKVYRGRACLRVYWAFCRDASQLSSYVMVKGPDGLPIYFDCDVMDQYSLVYERISYWERSRMSMLPKQAVGSCSLTKLVVVNNET